MSSPKLIGVLTPNIRLFRIWVKSEGKIKYNNTYDFVMINEIDHVRACVFYDVEIGHQYDTVKSWRDFLKMAKQRIIIKDV